MTRQRPRKTKKSAQGGVERLCRLARRWGADAVKVIGPADVFTADWVRLKCQYGCGEHGTRLTCPPYSPPPEVTRRVLDGYRTILLLHMRDWRDVRQVVPKLERAAFLEGYYRAFGLCSGPCELCEECNLESCLHPDEARPAMEACGIDVFQTARASGLPIAVCRRGDDEQNYYGLLLVE